MKKRYRLKPIRCVVILSAEEGIRDVTARENKQLNYISRYANGNNIKMLKIMHRAELAHPTLSLKVNQVIAMVAQGMADGLLISNMRCLTNDEEEAGRWIGAFSKAGGAIYSVDEGKLEYHFKGDKPNPNK